MILASLLSWYHKRLLQFSLNRTSNHQTFFVERRSLSLTVEIQRPVRKQRKQSSPVGCSPLRWHSWQQTLTMKNNVSNLLKIYTYNRNRNGFHFKTNFLTFDSSQVGTQNLFHQNLNTLITVKFYFKYFFRYKVTFIYLLHLLRGYSLSFTFVSRCRKVVVGLCETRKS